MGYYPSGSAAPIPKPLGASVATDRDNIKNSLTNKKYKNETN